MSNVVTFTDYRPLPRYDQQPWTEARIDEATDPAGTWTAIDTLPLTPLDTDPSVPAARSFTTSNATLASGWYRVVFLDATGAESFSVPVAYPPLDWQPNVDEVGALLRARTRKDLTGAETGTFDDETRPTGAEVREFIDRAVAEIQLRVQIDVPTRWRSFARGLAALRAAMQVELSYQPEMAEGTITAYGALRTQYETGIQALETALAPRGLRLA